MGHFRGVLSARPFDRAVITCPDDQVFLDDLHFGASIVGDVSFDGVVDVEDLVAVILSWGLCVGPPPAICLADLDFDGIVGPPDVAVLLAHWSVP